jgi:hypothetical protein
VNAARMYCVTLHAPRGTLLGSDFKDENGDAAIPRVGYGQVQTNGNRNR